MKPSEEEIGVAAPVDRIVRDGVVAETGKYVLDERRHPDGNGGPLVGEYYGPYWGIFMNGSHDWPIIIVADDGDGRNCSIARNIVQSLNRDIHEKSILGRSTSCAAIIGSDPFTTNHSSTASHISPQNVSTCNSRETFDIS